MLLALGYMQISILIVGIPSLLYLIRRLTTVLLEPWCNFASSP